MTSSQFLRGGGGGSNLPVVSQNSFQFPFSFLFFSIFFFFFFFTKKAVTCRCLRSRMSKDPRHYTGLPRRETPILSPCCLRMVSPPVHSNCLFSLFSCLSRTPFTAIRKAYPTTYAPLPHRRRLFLAFSTPRFLGIGGVGENSG